MIYVSGDGRLVADPELNRTKDRVCVRLRIAHNPRYRDRHGDWQEATVVFLQLEAWGSAAEAAAGALSKGSRVVFVGEMRASEWTDQDSGEKRRRQWVAATDIAPAPAPASQTDGPQRGDEGAGSESAPDELDPAVAGLLEDGA